MSDRIGAEASLQTQWEGTETKAGEYVASSFSPKNAKKKAITAKVAKAQKNKLKVGAIKEDMFF